MTTFRSEATMTRDLLAFVGGVVLAVAGAALAYGAFVMTVHPLVACVVFGNGAATFGVGVAVMRCVREDRSHGHHVR